MVIFISNTRHIFRDLKDSCIQTPGCGAQPWIEIQTKYAIKHNTVLHVSVHQNHHQAPLFQKFKHKKKTKTKQI